MVGIRGPAYLQTGSWLCRCISPISRLDQAELSNSKLSLGTAYIVNVITRVLQKIVSELKQNKKECQTSDPSIIRGGDGPKSYQETLPLLAPIAIFEP